jgi:hypothetical protein
MYTIPNFIKDKIMYVIDDIDFLYFNNLPDNLQQAYDIVINDKSLLLLVMNILKADYEEDLKLTDNDKDIKAIYDKILSFESYVKSVN